MSTPRQDYETLTKLRGRFRVGALGRREFLTAASGLAGAALLAGCAGGIKQNRGSAPANVIPLYTVENDPKTLAFYNLVIEDFRRDYPEASVEVTVYADANQLQYLTTAFQNGVDVGLFSPPVSSFPDFARAGHLASLDELVRAIGEADFLPGTRVRVDGRDVAIPMQANASLVYYRKDLLEGAGLDIPKTYPQYLDAIRALHGRDGVAGIAMGVGPTPQLPLQFFAPYLYQAGQDYFDRDGNLTFDAPGVLAAINRFVDVMRYAPKSMYNAEFGDIVSAYTSGRAAFATFPGRLGVVLAERDPELAARTGVMPIPAGDFLTGKLHFGSSQQYAIYSATANPLLAMEFAKALTTGPNAVAYAETVPGHLLPPLRSVRAEFASRLAAASDGYLAQHRDWIQTFLDHSVQAMTASVSMGAVSGGKFAGKFTNLCPFSNKIWASPPIDGRMMQAILLEGEPVEVAWRRACAEARQVVEAFRAANPGWTPEIV